MIFALSFCMVPVADAFLWPNLTPPPEGNPPPPGSRGTAYEPDTQWAYYYAAVAAVHSFAASSNAIAAANAANAANSNAGIAASQAASANSNASLARTAADVAASQANQARVEAQAAANQANAARLQAQLNHTEILNLRNAVNAIAADVIPPVVNLSWGSRKTATRNAAATLHIDAADNITGFPAMQFQHSVNNGAFTVWAPVQSQLSIPLSPGLNNIVVRVRDGAGNIANRNIALWRL